MQPGATSKHDNPVNPEDPADPEDQADLAVLAVLADALNTHTGLAALLLTPPGKPPWIDVGLHGVLAPGEKIRVQAGAFFWRLAEPLGPSDQPATVAALIARTLRAAGTGTGMLS
jgi:hypothetical protein